MSCEERRHALAQIEEDEWLKEEKRLKDEEEQEKHCLQAQVKKEAKKGTVKTDIYGHSFGCSHGL